MAKRTRLPQTHLEQAVMEKLVLKTLSMGWTQWWSMRKMGKELSLPQETVLLMVRKSVRVQPFNRWNIPDHHGYEGRTILFSEDIGDWLIQPLG